MKNRIESLNQFYSVKELVKFDKAEKLHFDHAIQRNTVWDEKRKSLLIHSLITGYPIPPVYCLDEGDSEWWFLDGKQRLTTLLSFMKDGFMLHESTPDVDGEKIAGKAFSQLDEEMQDDIESARIHVYQLRNMDADQIDTMFHRLNNGMPLKPIELTRVLAGSGVMKFMKEISETEFFDSKVVMTDTQKNRFNDEELILQIAMLIDNEGKALELGTNNIRDYAVKVKETGVSEDTQKVIRTTTEYMNKAFPEKESFLKKVHVPMLFIQAIKAQEKGVDESKFGGWALDFFTNRIKGTKYATASSAGTGREANVKARLEYMDMDFEYHVEKAPEWKSQEVRKAEKTAKQEAEKRAKAEEKARKEAEKAKKLAEEARAQARQNSGGKGKNGKSNKPADTNPQNESLPAVQ